MPWQDLSPLVRDHAPQVVYMWVESPRLPLRDDEDQPLSLSPGDTAVVVCLSTSWVGPWEALLTFIYRKEGKPPPPRQAGRLVRPIGDVYGDWKVVYRLPRLIDEPNCTRVPGSTSRSFSVSLGPSPGWPATGSE